MSTLSNIVKAVTGKRTHYRAMYKGKEITGCRECGNNQEFPGLMAFAPTHKCIITPLEGETFMTIFDPYNIPEECPIKIVPGGGP